MMKNLISYLKFSALLLLVPLIGCAAADNQGENGVMNNTQQVISKNDSGVVEEGNIDITDNKNLSESDYDYDAYHVVAANYLDQWRYALQGRDAGRLADMITPDEDNITTDIEIRDNPDYLFME